MHSVCRLTPTLKHIMLHDMPLYGFLPLLAQLVLHLPLGDAADARQRDSVGCEMVRGLVALLWLHLACMAAARLGLLTYLTLEVVTIVRSITADVRRCVGLCTAAHGE